MSVLGGTIGYRMLRTIAPVERDRLNGRSYSGRSKIEANFGCEIWNEIRNKTIIDYGCGNGIEAIELAQHGAGQVYGIDILEKRLEAARLEAVRAECPNVKFCRVPPEPADVIISIDGFEHFRDPAGVLESMAMLLKPGGSIFISFGPTWYHPLGGHLFSVFPWAHLVFEETALCRWRSHIRSDGAERFCDVDGGLNRMTIARFERLVRKSPLGVDRFETVPIRKARAFHNRMTREFLTAVVRCKLVFEAPEFCGVGEALALSASA